MFKTCLDNRITYTCMRDYKCHLCNNLILNNCYDSVLEHINKETHLKKLKKIDEAVRNLQSNELSLISEPKRRNIVENCITWTRKHKDLKCNICGCQLSGLAAAFQHIKGRTHTSNVQLMDKAGLNKIDNNTNTTNNVTNQIKENKIVNSTKRLDDCITYDANSKLHTCNICICSFSEEVDVSLHISGFLHNLCLNAKKSEQAAIDSNKENITINNCFNTSNNSDFIQIYYCSACSLWIKTTDHLMCHSMLHLHQEIKLGDIDIIQFNFNNKNKIQHLRCLLCKTNFNTDKDLEEHVNTRKHLARLDFFKCLKQFNLRHVVDNYIDREKLKSITSNFKEKLSSDAFLCKVCNVPMSQQSISEHTKGKQHNQNLQKPCPKVPIVCITSMYTCFLCELAYDSAILLLSHYKTTKHKQRMQNFNEIINCSDIHFIKSKNDKDEVIHCKICRTTIYACRSVVDHLYGQKHKAKEKQLLKPETGKLVDELFVSNNENVQIDNSKNDMSQKVTASIKIKKINEFKTSSDELIKLGFSPEVSNQLVKSKLDSSEVDDVLNNLVDLNLNKEQQKKLILSKKKRPRTPNIDSKKNSFEKNVSIYGKDYILLCIDPGKVNIYNVNPEKLRLMELGVSLTFPWESERVCPPCAQQFSSNKQFLFEHLHEEEHVRHLCEMEANHKEFEDYPDQFSDLDLAKSYLIEESETCVQCHACNEKIENENAEILFHIKSSNHSIKSQSWKMLSEEINKEFSTIFKDIWYYAEVFICEICTGTRFDLEIDFVMHLKTPEHQQKVNSSFFNGIIPEYDVCPICITYWVGKPNTFIKHCKNSFHQRFAKTNEFQVSKMTSSAIDFLINANEEIRSLIKKSDEVTLNKHKEYELLKAIEDNVVNIYPKAQAYTFGSRLSSLGFPDSDVDVFLDCNNIYHESTTQEQSQKYLSSVRKNFETKPEIWMVDEILLATRVPIIKLRHLPTGLKCDISFVNGLSVEKSTLIKYYNDAYPICRELILYLKKWFTFCQLSGSRGITTFAISWYVIFYLQIKRILPSVHKLIELKNQSKIVDGWECGFLETVPVNASNLNFKNHLKGFFFFYADFDYKTNIACPYLGKAIPKRSFAFTEQLPDQMEIYKKRVTLNESEIFRFDSPMCIQDPIDLSQNITKAVRKRQLRSFRQYCFESAEKIV